MLVLKLRLKIYFSPETAAGKTLLLFPRSRVNSQSKVSKHLEVTVGFNYMCVDAFWKMCLCLLAGNFCCVVLAELACGLACSLWRFHCVDLDSGETEVLGVF